jgi:hypothetical protein
VVVCGMSRLRSPSATLSHSGLQTVRKRLTCGYKAFVMLSGTMRIFTRTSPGCSQGYRS